MATTREPRTLQEAILHFADYANCHKAVMAIRWPNGTVACPRCGSLKVTYLEKARLWKCYETHPKAKFSLKVGTVFEDSPLPLQKWLPALWLLMNCKNGISSYELSRALGVTQKTAWFMLSRLRLALNDDPASKFTGHVEADETFIGGRARNMHKDKRKRLALGRRSLVGKVAVMGVLERTTKERHSTVRLKVLSGLKKSQIQDTVRDYVALGANVSSDAFLSYAGLDKHYVHTVIDHAEKYADGIVHTNGMENFWALLKRAIKGTYISVEPFHLFRYLDEQAFRFNNREMTDAARFTFGLKGILGKRLTYAGLTGSELPQTC
jgi:transposase-like protein